MLTSKLTIGDVIEHLASDAPFAPALRARRLLPASYAALATLIDTTRAFLNASGIGRGDRVAVIISEPARAMTAYLGVMNSAVAVPMNPNSTDFELERLFRDLNLAGVLLSDDLAHVADIAARASLPVFWVAPAPDNVTGSFALTGSATRSGSIAGMVKVEDIACIQTSSGTTGRAKATLQSHAVLVYRMEKDRRILRLSPDDVMVNFRPPYLSGPLNIGLLGSVCSGGSVVVPPQFDADRFLEDLLEFGVTWYTGGPAYHRAILENARAHPEAVAGHSLRFIRSAGYSLPKELQDQLETTFGVPCIQKYGSSEAGLVACNPLPPGRRKVGTCGPISECEVRIVSDDGTNLPAHEVGEIWVRGPGVFSGYDNKETNGAAFSDDWFKTGDLGFVDSEGYLSITGRLNEIINRGGQKIAPQEVEEIYASLPGVAEALCFPIPHSTLGATAGLAVVPRDGTSLDPDYLRTLASELLSRFKQPETILVVGSLPRGPTGKPLRKQAASVFDVVQLTEANNEDGRPPADQLEEIWCDSLRITAVHEGQNFTRLGGDSLRAMRLVLGVEQVFGVLLLPEVVYSEGATLGGLRNFIKKSEKSSAKRRVLPRRQDPRADLPLTSSQSRIWSICKTFPDVALYNSSFGLRFPGPLELSALKRALDLTVERHEALRAIFPEVAGAPRQQILPILSVPLEIIDLTKENIDQTTQDTARRIAGAPYDLAAGPLTRHVVLLVPGGAVLLHQTHHIIGDAISTSILAREISAAYTAIQNGAEPDLPEIERTFGDFVEDQAKRLTNPRKEELLNFWMKELDGVETVLELPTDRSRPSVRSHKGARVFFNFGNTLDQDLRKLAADHGTSLFATALAAFELLVYRLTGNQKFIVGTAIDTRPSEFRDQIVGFCLNTVPLAARLRPEQKFGDLLAAVGRGLQSARAHAEVPFDAIVQRMAPDRRGSVMPVVQVLFGHMPRGTRPSDISGTEAGLWNFDHNRARFDISIMLDETDMGLGGFIEYSTDLYEAETIRLVIERFRTLLKAIVANPTRRLSDYPILPPNEQQLVEQFSEGPRTDYPRDVGVVEIFDRVARKNTNATAVVFGEQRVTYGQLDRCSDRIAVRLVSEGVGRENIVGISAERTPEAIAGIIGILKAGGAYTAIDAKLPAPRIAHMLRDTEATLVLVQTGSNLSLDNDVPALHLGKESEGLEVERGHEAWAGQPCDLAYVCYTSGTTGLPKGVEIEQRSILRLVLGANYAQFGSDERILMTGVLGFDASTFEIWGALLNGGTLVLPETENPSLSELARLIEREAITTIWLTSGLFRQVVDHRPDCFRNVRQVLTGGDVVSAEHVLRLMESAPDCRVINGYGPTENTTFSVCGELDSATIESGLVPIGQPIANSTAYILDSGKAQLPIGVAGDLYVGGDGIARGYRGLPDQTESVFGPDPFSGLEAARMYRTGDRARFRRDGRIEFLGRQDLQVKIRGFRVELEEIEAVLRAHPEVQDALVVARIESGVARTLHAFVVCPENRQRPQPEILRAYFARHLPDFMQPATFALLDAFPLNLSGKIDRQTLLDLVAEDRKYGKQSAAPQTRIEQLLAQIWSELLPGEHSIGRDDDFFALGGDSLVVLRLGFRIEEETGIEMPQIELFSNASLKLMATRIEAALLDLDITNQVYALWREVAQAEPASPMASFFDEGGDEFLLAQLARSLSDLCQVEISMVDVFADPSVRGFALIVACARQRKKRPSAIEFSAFNPVTSLLDGSTSVPVVLGDGRNSFFIVSGAGGHVLPFVPVARRLDVSWHGIGLLDPTFDSASPRPTKVGDVSAALMVSARLADPQGPYLIVGYSYGAQVAFEMARKLRERGTDVGLVVLDSKCRTSSRKMEKSLQRVKSRLKSVLKRVRILDAPVGNSYENPRHDEIARRERTRRSEIADLQRAMVDRYIPRSCDIPLVLIRTGMSAPGEERDHGWSRVARVIGVLNVGGDHLSLFKGEHEEGFVQALDEALKTLQNEICSRHFESEL